MPTLGLSWAQLQRQMPPHRTKFRMLSPTCVQTCPIALCWTEFGASYAAQLRPRTAKFDPSPLSVGPSRPDSFLSVVFPGCGRFSTNKLRPNRHPSTNCLGDGKSARSFKAPMPWPQNTNTPTQFLKNRWASQSFTQFQTIPLTSLVHRTHEYFIKTTPPSTPKQWVDSRSVLGNRVKHMK